MAAPRPSNRLANEPSLYLRQHGSNPVDWYPWGEEAFARAQRENKPILLSIGYSACHWCHVMERECFENEAIAERMNELFVCVKVDREERPDVDNLYMKSVQMMTGRGGWPMTVFTTPDRRPYYAGTYFPPEDRGDMPGFARVLAGAARAYHENTAEVAERGAEVVRLLDDATDDEGVTRRPFTQTLGAATQALVEMLDAEHGGFGREPKFPASLALALLMGAEKRAPETRRRGLLIKALDAMAAGGIHDQLAGGFHRYSVDRYWLVPHFEKMLYDQALLTDLYREAWLALGKRFYAEVVMGIADYVCREMTAEAGGFFSTQDADSEGVEGRFFVWTAAEVAEVVDDGDVELVRRLFGITDGGNFEGSNVLHRAVDIDELAGEIGRAPRDIAHAVERARRQLLVRRGERVAPATDEKILADWNGLMIGALAKAGQTFARADLTLTAARAADFVRAHMANSGRLQHFFADGSARVDGFLDDYAFFGRGCLELFYARRRREDFETALWCADVLLERFADPARGGFLFNAVDGETLIARTREVFDGAVPAGNSVAAELLLRLYQLTGREEYRRGGERTLDAFLATAAANPYGGAHLLLTAMRHAEGFATVVISGGEGGEGLEAAALGVHMPGGSVLAAGQASWLPEALKSKPPVDGAATAYVCRGPVCGPPAATVEALMALLD